MKIYGLQKTTLLDYPGKVACTVFTGGCNFRCPFCHNASIVLTPSGLYDEEDILGFLKKRAGTLDGVCVTGGEPTLHKDLPEFLNRIKDMNLLVKLDSNGYRPEVLKALYEGHLIDYVAMDIKSSPENYGKAVGIDNFDIQPVRESVDFLKTSGIDYELRTTLVKGLHTLKDMDGIGEFIRGAKEYFLQDYKESQDIIGSKNGDSVCFSSFSQEEMNSYKNVAEKYVENVNIRGI